MPFATPESEPSTVPRAGGARVEVRGLVKSFLHGGRRLDILQGIDLVLEPGEMVAVVGASGVGKSTLLHCLGTLDLPSSGSIVIGGVEVTRMNPSQLAAFRNRSIGFVFQFHYLLPEFTALENVMMPALIQRVSRSEAEARASRILDRVGLSHRVTHKPGELSGGEQQRVALARALILEPKLLLADEPTGNLDAATGAGVIDLMFELNAQARTTLVLVTHDEAIARRCARQIRLVAGRIDGAG